MQPCPHLPEGMDARCLRCLVDRWYQRHGVDPAARRMTVVEIQADVAQSAWQALDGIMVDAGMDPKLQPEAAQAWLRERLGAGVA